MKEVRKIPRNKQEFLAMSDDEKWKLYEEGMFAMQELNFRKFFDAEAAAADEMDEDDDMTICESKSVYDEANTNEVARALGIQEEIMTGNSIRITASALHEAGVDGDEIVRLIRKYYGIGQETAELHAKGRFEYVDEDDFTKCDAE